MAEHLTFAQAEEYRTRLGLSKSTPIYPGLSAGTIQIPVSHADGTAVADGTEIASATVHNNVIVYSTDFRGNTDITKELNRFKLAVPIGHDIVKYNHDPLSSLGKVERALGVPLREVDDRDGKKRIAIDAELTAAEAQIIENRIDQLIKEAYPQNPNWTHKTLGKINNYFGGASQSVWPSGKAMVSLDYCFDDKNNLSDFWKGINAKYLTNDLRNNLQAPLFSSQKHSSTINAQDIQGFADETGTKIHTVNGKYVVVLPDPTLANNLAGTLRNMAGDTGFRYGADNNDYLPGFTYAKNLISVHDKEVRIDPLLNSGKIGTALWLSWNNILEPKLDNSEFNNFRGQLFTYRKEAADKILENSGTRIDAALKNAQDSAKKAEEIAKIMADKEAAETAKKAANDAKKAADDAKTKLNKIKLTDGLSKDGKEENDRLIAQAQELVTTVTAAQKKAEDNLKEITKIAKDAKVPIDDIIKTTLAAAKEPADKKAPNNGAGQQTADGNSKKTTPNEKEKPKDVKSDDTPNGANAESTAPADGAGSEKQSGAGGSHDKAADAPQGGPHPGPNQNQAANPLAQNAFSLLGAGLPLLMMLMGFMDPIMGIIALIAGLVIGGTMDAQNGGFLGSLFSGQQPAPPVTLKSLDKDGSTGLSVNELKALSSDGNLSADELAKFGAEGQTLVNNIAQLVEEKNIAKVFTRENNDLKSINLDELGNMLAPNTQIQILEPTAGRRH